MQLKSLFSPHIFYYEIRKRELDITNSGRRNIKTHFSQKKHRLPAKTVTTSVLRKNFCIFMKVETNSINLITIKPMQRFRSFHKREPNVMLARTKSEAIVKNILARESQHTLETVWKKANFLIVIIDSTNQKEIKIDLLIVRYIS